MIRPLLDSIQARLTLTLGAIALAVFSSAGLLLYWVLERELVRRDTADLTTQVEMVLHLATEVRGLAGLADLFHKLDDMRLSHENLEMWIVHRDGRLVYGRSSAPQTVGWEGALTLLQPAAGPRLIGLLARFETGPGLQGAQLIVAKDPRPRLQLLATYRITLLLVCSAGVLTAAGLGAWAARRGLKPIASLSEQAAHITPGTLSLRLSMTGTERELRSLAGAFNDVLERLEAAYLQMEAFNADVAHELRTPLAVLINGAQVVLSAPRSAQELREALASILEDAEHLKTMVNDMLFLARADAGERLPAPQRVSLAEQARTVREFYEAILDEHRVALAIEGDADVVCSPGLVRRAMANLLSNALRFTAAGETIRLGIAQIAGGVRIVLRNPGAEVPSEVLQHMFDRFYRAEPARARTTESAGLGLAIVRAIARMHGGEAFASWEDGETTVGMTLRP